MKAALQQAIKTAFNQMGNLKIYATLKRKVGSDFDPSMGKEVPVYEEHDVEIFVSSFDKRVVDGITVSLQDQKILLPAHQIDFQPVPEDDLIIIDGKTHALEMVQSKFGEMFVLKI